MTATRWPTGFRRGLLILGACHLFLATASHAADIAFTLDKPGRVSVLHNGIAIHSDTVILGETFWHQPPGYQQHADALPLMIQDHGNPVQFRSIWVRPFEPVAAKPLP
jgi:hypothetical protein